jgi:hypothetical protein
MRYLVLFSPALVLLAMTLAVAINDGMVSTTLVVVFLAVLTVSMAAAEAVRFQLRQEVRDRERENL